MRYNARRAILFDVGFETVAYGFARVANRPAIYVPESAVHVYHCDDVEVACGVV